MVFEAAKMDDGSISSVSEYHELLQKANQSYHKSKQSKRGRQAQRTTVKPQVDGGKDVATTSMPDGTSRILHAPAPAAPPSTGGGRDNEGIVHHSPYSDSSRSTGIRSLSASPSPQSSPSRPISASKASPPQEAGLSGSSRARSGSGDGAVGDRHASVDELADGLPQPLDQDVENLSESLDRMTYQMKRELMEAFLSMKHQVLSENQMKLEKERRAVNASLEDMKVLVNQHKEIISNQNAECDRLEGRVSSAADLIGRNIERKGVVSSQKAKRRSLKTAQTHFNTRLSKRVLAGWRATVSLDTRKVVDTFWQEKLEAVSTSLVQQYEEKLFQLRELLHSTEQQLMEETHLRGVAEENLKKAFMREVCSLNLRTMNVMKGTPIDENDPSSTHQSFQGSYGKQLSQPNSQRSSPRVEWAGNVPASHGMHYPN